MFKKLVKLDWVIVTTVLLLLSVGVLVIYSISTSGGDGSIFIKQLIFSAIGIGVMLAVAVMDYHYFNSYSRKIYFVSILALVLVLFFGSAVRGTAGWIGFGFAKIQPVEFIKIGLIVFLASFISQKKSELKEGSRLIVSFFLTAILVFLVLRQPDLGSAIILVGIWAGMVLISGISKRSIAILILVGFLAASIGWFFLADYQKNRILNFLDPSFDIKGAGYNVNQAVIAVGSGGLMGKGVGHGSQSQLNFLPEKHTDFIFAAVTEELGIVGAFLTLFLYGVLFFKMRHSAMFSQDNFGYLLVSGVMVMLFLQMLINVGMNIGIIPVTGIPLPFLSYGGSSLFSFFVALGIVLSVNRKKDMLNVNSTQSY
jgi:rod shape determining protein RodA